MLKAMSKPQGVLKMFMLGVLKTILKTVLKYEKKPTHFTARVEIQWQISFLSFGFARVTEVRHMYTATRLMDLCKLARTFKFSYVFFSEEESSCYNDTAHNTCHLSVSDIAFLHLLSLGVSMPQY